MVGNWMAKLGMLVKTKVGLALVGAVLIGGGGSAIAMADSNPQVFSHLVADITNTSPTHSEATAEPTKAGKQGDKDKENAACASRTPEAKGTESAETHAQGTPSTRTDAGDSHEGTEADCEGHDKSPTGTRTPEWSGTPQANPSGGEGDD